MRVEARSGACLAFWSLVALVQPATADPISDFYAGKRGTVFIGYGPSGNYDLYGRLGARHLGRHIPGAPTLIAQNMPGAASLTLANHLYNVAKKDGTVFGVMNEALPLEQLITTEPVSFDANQYNWIGRFTTSINLTFVWNTIPVQTIDDVRKRTTLVGGTGPASITAFGPWLLNNLAGTKFKVITGFNSSNDVVLAIQRNEVEGGLITLEGLNAEHPEWIKQKQIKILVQYDSQRISEISDVPSMVELGKTPQDRQILKLYSSASNIGRSLTAPPGIPPARVTALRRAFDAMAKDPLFLEEAKRLRLTPDTLSGEELQKVVSEVFSFPKELITAAQSAREKSE